MRPAIAARGSLLSWSTRRISTLPPIRGWSTASQAARALGGHDWLFVGQMLPHKAHHDVIKALACARKMFDPTGPPAPGRPRELRSVCGRIAQVRVRTRLDLQLSSSWARSAQESSPPTTRAQTCSFAARTMRGSAYRCWRRCTTGCRWSPMASAAVPETLLDAGIVLPSKSPVLVATAVQRVLTDHKLHDALVSAGVTRTRSFTVRRRQARLCAGNRAGATGCLRLQRQRR